jgi:hypothetical protein
VAGAGPPAPLVAWPPAPSGQEPKGAMNWGAGPPLASAPFSPYSQHFSPYRYCWSPVASSWRNPSSSI